MAAWSFTGEILCLAALSYIHYNPVKHGLVMRVADWPLSSFHRYVAQGILPGDWAGNATELSGRFGE